MKRYIKLNSNSEITDIFTDNIVSKFDGTEIYLDDVGSYGDVYINGKCISDEFGNPLFRYQNGIISDIYRSEYVDQYRKKIIANLRDLCESHIYARWSDIYQRNLANDSANNIDALSIELSQVITADEVAKTRSAVMIAIAQYCATADYISVTTNKDTINIDTIISALNITKSKHIDYIRKIVESVCVYRLIRAVRIWSNDKESEINTSTDPSSVSLSDIPAIS